MSDFTAVVIGASGRMGQEHIAAYEACGVEVVERGGDIISIASPDYSHAGWVCLGFKDGLHVFCEKPLATNSRRFEEMKSVQTVGGHLGQNFPLRYHRDSQRLKSEIQVHRLGDIYRIDAAYNWGRSYKLQEGWRARDKSYSLVMGGLIHMVDIVLWATGLNMEVISAIGTNQSTGFHNYDTVTALCRLSNGGICSLTVDGGTGVKRHGHFLRVHGSKEPFCIENFNPTDKQACIKEFVKDIREGKPPKRDFRATEICLEIEKRASISADR